MKIVLATHNEGKMRELKQILAAHPIEILPLTDFEVPEPNEDGLSFIENAILKARHCARLTDLPAIADDSGLCVDALGGAPGIHSARYAHPEASAEDNIEKLLQAIRSLTGEERSAHFHCTLAYVRHANDPTPLICQGHWSGEILTKPQGDGGFGYDPIFFVPSHRCSAAELPPGVKNTISHRALALRQLSQRLDALLQGHTPHGL